MELMNWDKIHASGKQYTLISDELVDLILKHSANPKKILDIGCGTGDLLIKFAKRGLIVTGVDISSVALENAKIALNAENLEATLKVVDFESTRFISEIGAYFDIVVTRLTLAFAKDKYAFLSKVKNLLTSNGVFVCSTPVLIEDEEYDDRQKRISILESELESLLHGHFVSVMVLVSDESNRSKWPLRTYLCRLK